MPSDLSGEAVKVCIVKKDPSLTKEEVLDHCRRQLTGYKVPKIIEFRDELPKTNVGKILRRELRDEAKREAKYWLPLYAQVNAGTVRRFYGF